MNKSTSEPAHGDMVVDGRYGALPDPISDRIFAVVMSLSTEVWVLRDRLTTLESALREEHRNVIDQVVERRGTDTELKATTADREAFIERILAGVR